MTSWNIVAKRHADKGSKREMRRRISISFYNESHRILKLDLKLLKKNVMHANYYHDGSFVRY